MQLYKYLRLWIFLKYAAKTSKPLFQLGSFFLFIDISRVDVSCNMLPPTLVTVAIIINKTPMQFITIFYGIYVSDMHFSLEYVTSVILADLFI